MASSSRQDERKGKFLPGSRNDDGAIKKQRIDPSVISPPPEALSANPDVENPPGAAVVWDSIRKCFQHHLSSGCSEWVAFATKVIARMFNSALLNYLYFQRYQDRYSKYCL